MEINVDDLQQYQRRTSVRIENIPYVKGESEDQLRTKVVNVLTKAGVEVKDDTICRLHRPGKPHPLRKNRSENEAEDQPPVIVAQTIVKFRHWAPKR